MRRLVGIAVLSGCTTLHHVQVGEIDNSGDAGMRPFEITAEAGAVDTEQVLEQISSNLATIASLATMGPRTGLPLMQDRLAERLVERIYAECPSGEVTGLIARRESLRIPFGGLESVIIRGYCRVD